MEIENTRDKLNILIKNKEIITNDKELLELSIKLDKLIMNIWLLLNVHRYFLLLEQLELMFFYAIRRLMSINHMIS